MREPEEDGAAHPGWQRLMGPAFCAVRRRQLAHWAALGDVPPSDSSLSLHLEDCASCRDYFHGLLQVAGALRIAVRAPAPPDHFTARVTQRIAARGTRVRVGAATLCVAAGVAAAFIAAVSPKESRFEAARQPLVISHSVATVPLPAIPAPTGQPMSRPTRSAAPRPRSVRARPARLRPLRLARRPSRPARPGPTLGRPVPADTWTLCGLVSSEAGEHRLAAALYARALESGGPPSLAFAAAEQAEAAGDVADAVDYYSQILASPPAEAPNDSPSR